MQAEERRGRMQPGAEWEETWAVGLWTQRPGGHCGLGCFRKAWVSGAAGTGVCGERRDWGPAGVGCDASAWG